MARSRNVSVQYAIDRLTTVQLLKLHEAMQSPPMTGPEESVAEQVERIERSTRDALKQAFTVEAPRKRKVKVSPIYIGDPQ